MKLRTLEKVNRAANKRGFTLIEMSVVLIIIAALAAAVVPNLVRGRQAEIRRDFEAKLYRFVSDARERAIQEKRTLALTLDSSTREFSIIRETPEGEEETLNSITMPEGLDTGSMAAEGNEATSSEWKLHFYSDGTTDGGGLELNDNGRIRALELKTDGSMKMVEGELQETGTDKWPAGEIEKRVQTQ